MSTDLGTIRAALAAATAAATWWIHTHATDDNRTVMTVFAAPEDVEGVSVAFPIAEPTVYADTFLIANAPAWLAELADRVEAAEVSRRLIQAERYRLAAITDRVRELHEREVIAVHEGYGVEAWCPTCREHYPCETVRALDGAGAQAGPAASGPVLVPPRQAEAADRHPRRAESEVQAEALRRVAAMPAARRVNTSNGNTDGREWLNFCADQIDRGARL